MKKNSILVPFLAILVLLAGHQIASACSCGATPNVLDSFEGAKNVVVVKAVEVEKFGKDEPNYPVDGVRSTKMVVEKVYKGNLKAGDEITFAQGGGADCIWTFKEESVGRRYLFYLDEGDKTSRWIGFGCGRSSSIEGAGDDLLYLEKLEKVRGKTRISGTVQFDALGDTTTPNSDGIKIRIVGGSKNIVAKTDRNGVYEVYDLPAGKYKIIPEVPRGWKVNRFYLTYVNDIVRNRSAEDEDDEIGKDIYVQMKEKRHAAVDFHFEIDNALRGKIYGPTGQLMKGVCVRLFPPSGITKDFRYEADCTEENGAFELDEIPPGSYIIVANDENKITSHTPFRTLYYPGVFELEKASVVTIGIGEYREDLNIHVPSIEELVTVNGAFAYSDGKPVVGEDVHFESYNDSSGRDSDVATTTDSRGRFSIKILKGATGRLFGSMYTFSGEFENCPKLEALIKKSDKSSFQPQTQSLEITAETDIYDVELKFPFPSCKKVRID